jgi:hypothetical protein
MAGHERSRLQRPPAPSLSLPASRVHGVWSIARSSAPNIATRRISRSGSSARCARCWQRPGRTRRPGARRPPPAALPPIAKTCVVVKLPAPPDNTAKKQSPAVPELPLRHRITEDGLDRLREAWLGSAIAAAALPRVRGRQAGAEESRRFADRLGALVHQGQGSMSTDVGLAIKAAIERGDAHTAMNQGRLRVRL